MLHGVPPPPPVRIHGRDERCPDACAPLYAPLTEEEQQILAAEDLDPSQLLQMLRKLLQKHRTPVRHLFRGLASPDGGLTRRDLHNSLGCLGIKLTPWSCDNLFRALLEYAIEDGEVTLSYHVIHKALLHNFKGAECISALEKERREILDKMNHAIATCSAARRAEVAATQAATQAEVAAEKAVAEANEEAAERVAAAQSAASEATLEADGRVAAADAAVADAVVKAEAAQAAERTAIELAHAEAAARLQAQAQTQGLAEYVSFLETAKAEAEARADDLMNQLFELRLQLKAAQRIPAA